MNTIEIYAGELEINLIKNALETLLDKVSSSGDVYDVARNVEGLINQFNEMETK